VKSVTVVTAVEKRPVSTLPVRPPLWMQLEDREVFGYIRSCAPCPAVFVLKEDPHALMDEQQQYFVRAINFNMTLENAFLLLDTGLAYANMTGFRHDGKPKADYFHRKDLDQKPPALDKVRTNSRCVLTGTPAYSLALAIKQMFAAANNTLTRRSSFLAFRQSFRTLLTEQNVLKVTLFDSRQPPPLKPGKRYPTRIEDVNPDDYLYLPETHPWMFLVANIVNRSGEVVQFPRGGLYPWTKDGTPRSFLPHIANFTYGDVLYPLSKLRKVADTAPIPTPYRSL
jgi:hypothetical protein